MSLCTEENPGMYAELTWCPCPNPHLFYGAFNSLCAERVTIVHPYQDAHHQSKCDSRTLLQVLLPFWRQEYKTLAMHRDGSRRVNTIEKLRCWHKESKHSLGCCVSPLIPPCACNTSARACRLHKNTKQVKVGAKGRLTTAA